MRVVAFNGSARKGGNTRVMIDAVFGELEAEGVETECVEMAGAPIVGCIACYKCHKNKDKHCAVRSDPLNYYIDLMLGADGIILASPVYFANNTATMQALIERAGMVARANADMLARKVGASVVVARRGGCVTTFDALNHFFFIGQMVVPGSHYWNMGHGKDKGDVRKDGEALSTMRALGKNMSWLLHKLHG